MSDHHDIPQPACFGPYRARMAEGRTLSRNLREFGIVQSESGDAVPWSDIRSGELTTEHFTGIPAARPERLDGPVLFAGLAMEQFGHVLMNALGRLWALDALPGETRLLFYPKRRAAMRNFPHLPPVLDWLGIDAPVIVSRGPLDLEAVHTATDLFGERHGGRGSAGFYDWLDGRLPVLPPIERGRRIYVSRSGLGPKAGRFADEEHLERLLAGEGYEVFRPEEHTLAIQTETLRRAEKLIIAEGSALHLYALVRRPGQAAAVVARRRDVPDLIRAQLADRGGIGVPIIDAIDEIHHPPVRSGHLMVSTLDFGLLRHALSELGLVSREGTWLMPDPEWLAGSINAGLEPGQRMMNAEEHRRFLRALKARRGMPAGDGP